MPIYLYRCKAGHETELQRPPEDANRPTHCAECGEPAERVFKLRGIGFKGHGFYATDYGRPS